MGDAVKAALLNLIRVWRDMPQWQKLKIKDASPMLYTSLQTLRNATAKSKYFRE